MKYLNKYSNFFEEAKWKSQPHIDVLGHKYGSSDKGKDYLPATKAYNPDAEIGEPGYEDPTNIGRKEKASRAKNQEDSPQRQALISAELKKSSAMGDIQAIFPRPNLYKVERNGNITFYKNFGTTFIIYENEDDGYTFNGKKQERDKTYSDINESYPTLEDCLRGLWSFLVARMASSVYDRDITRDIVTRKYSGAKKTIKEILDTESVITTDIEEAAKDLSIMFNDLGLSIDYLINKGQIGIEVRTNLMAIPGSLIQVLTSKYTIDSHQPYVFINSDGFEYANNEANNTKFRFYVSNKKAYNKISARNTQEVVKKITEKVKEIFENKETEDDGLIISKLIIDFCKFSSYKEVDNTKALYQAIKKSRQQSFIFKTIKNDLPELWDKLAAVGNEAAMTASAELSD